MDEITDVISAIAETPASSWAALNAKTEVIRDLIHSDVEEPHPEADWVLALFDGLCRDVLLCERSRPADSVTITVPAATANALQRLAGRCAAADRRRAGATTHGALSDINDLIMMLAEDAAMVVTRPGSWEATAMADLLGRHGYQDLDEDASC